MYFSRGSSKPRDLKHISYVPCIAGVFFTTSITWEDPHVSIYLYSYLYTYIFLFVFCYHYYMAVNIVLCIVMFAFYSHFPKLCRS